jgi:phosphatidylglycerophosphate synthase
MTVALDLRDTPLAMRRIGGLAMAARNAILAHRGGATEIVLVGTGADRAEGEVAREFARRGIGTPLRRAAEPPGGAIVWPADLFVGRRPPQPLERLTGPPEPDWLLVRDERDRRRAERALMRSLRKPEDGVVARFNRYVSLALSRPLLDTPVSPNAVSVLALGVGVACGLLAATGRRPEMVFGAFLFWFNCVLDGIDGEIARAKHLESKLGEWLDTWCDDLTNFSFALGLGVGLFRQTGRGHYVALGAAAALAVVLGAAFMYRYLFRIGTGDLNAYRLPHEGRGAAAPPGTLSRLLSKLRVVVRRDVFCAVAFGLALLDQLALMAWLMAVGGTAVWVTIAVETLLARRES